MDSSTDFNAVTFRAALRDMARMMRSKYERFPYTCLVATLPDLKLPRTALFEGHVFYGSDDPDRVRLMVEGLIKVTDKTKAYQFRHDILTGRLGMPSLEMTAYPAFVYRCDKWVEYHVTDYAWASGAGVGQWISYRSPSSIPAGYALPTGWAPLAELYPGTFDFLKK